MCAQMDIPTHTEYGDKFIVTLSSTNKEGRRRRRRESPIYTISLDTPIWFYCQPTTLWHQCDCLFYNHLTWCLIQQKPFLLLLSLLHNTQMFKIGNNKVILQTQKHIWWDCVCHKVQWLATWSNVVDYANFHQLCYKLWCVQKKL